LKQKQITDHADLTELNSSVNFSRKWPTSLYSNHH
jgi:hypothetical protein